MKLVRSIIGSKVLKVNFGKTLKLNVDTIFGYYYGLIKEKHKQNYERSDINFEEVHLDNMISL